MCQCLSSLRLNEFTDGASTTDEGKVFRSLTTLWVKNMRTCKCLKYVFYVYCTTTSDVSCIWINFLYSRLFSSITVRTGILYRLGLGLELVLVLQLSAFERIMSNDCSGGGAPSVQLVRHFCCRHWRLLALGACYTNIV